MNGERSKMDERKFDIICFGEDWYSPSVGVTKQVMQYFRGKGHRVIWVNPIAYRVPSIGSKTFKKRLVYKIKSHLKLLRKVHERQFISCPIYVPFVGSRIVTKINKQLLKMEIGLIKKILNIRNYIYWGTCGYTVNNIFDQIRKDDLFIYNFCDKFSSHRGISEKVKVLLEEKDVEIINKANLILCSSEKLYEYVLVKTNERKKVVYLPHGVDFDHFSRANEADLGVPDDIGNVKHPIIGYFGSMGDGFDREVIKYCAEKRPEWSFVLVGGSCEELRSFKNVYQLGPKDYGVIPNYGKCFDVCIMNWIPHEWADYCFPIKTMEYLAMGKPVVSIPIYEIEKHYSEIVSIAYGREEFVKQIQLELQNDSTEKRIRRVEMAKHSRWEIRLEPIYEMIQDLL